MEVATQTIEEGDLIPSKEIPKPAPIQTATNTTYERRLDITENFKGTFDKAVERAIELVDNAKKDGLNIVSIMVSLPWHQEGTSFYLEWDISVRASSIAMVSR